MAEDDDVSAIMQALQAVLGELDPELAEQDLDVDADLFSAGYVDSRSVLGLLAYVEETYGIDDLEAERLGEDLATLRALATWVSEHETMED